MRVSVSKAKNRLTDLMKRVKVGEEVIITRHGHDVVRLTPVVMRVARIERRPLMNEVRARAAVKALPGADAARSQDFLYNNDNGHLG